MSVSVLSQRRLAPPASRFWGLYVVCLGALLGMVELAGFVAPPTPEIEPPQAVEQVAVAMPPRPDGVRDVQGEGDEVYRYTEQACLKLDGQYRDICYHQLARQRAVSDLQGALDACDATSDDNMRQECQADSAEVYSLVDRDAALAICPTIKRKKWRDQCTFGIALAWSTKDSPWAFRLCDKAGKWRDFCRHDVNGEIAQVNDALAMEHCHAEEGDLLRRKSCWHGIGKYVARVDVSRAFRLCEAVPLGPEDLYRENCYHGLGWGAAETAGAEFVTSCDRAGEKRDSCMMGVAYNLRRFDIPRGLEICAAVQRADLKAQCVRFVEQGRL